VAVTTQQTAELSPINITVVNAQNIGVRVVYNLEIESMLIHPTKWGYRNNKNKMKTICIN
jgi:hypothetical protein